jgi:hypothetical protein
LLIPPSKGTPKQKAAPKATSFLAPTSKAKPESRVVLGKPASVPAIASGRVVPTVILEPVPKAPHRLISTFLWPRTWESCLQELNCLA